MTTNVTPPTFTTTGLVLPEQSAILTGVQADYNDAFGGTLNPALNTPQGQLASSTTDIIAGNNDLFAEFVNQVNPDTASGFMQDAIARIYYLTRTAGAPTVVTCTCTGVDGTVIPVGAQAQDTSGNRYVSTSTGVIASGVVTITFANILDGPIACPTGTLTGIYQGITGWDGVSNPGDGVVGHNVESQADFAFRRQQSVAANAHGSLQAVQGAVFSVADVLDVYTAENFTNAPITVGSTSYTLSPHSLYVAVVGGLDADVATAIWSKKDLGCDMNGNTTVSVTDTVGYSVPYPAYVVTFERPAAVPILFAVSIKNVAGLPADVVALTKAAIIAAFNGTDGSARARIGSQVFASSYYAPILRAVPSAPLISVLVGTSSATLTSVTVGADQVPTINATNIAVSLV